MALPLTPPPPETLALRALAWMAERPEVFGGFLGTSGLVPADLRRVADEPGFLGSVLDYLLEDENRARDCAEALGLPPEAMIRARAALPGGQAPHWT